MIEVLRIVVAPLVWLATFSAIYALHGLGCALRWPDVELAFTSLLRASLVVAWFTGMVMQIALLVALCSRWRSESEFVRKTSVMTGWTGLIATLWTLHPVAITSTCG